MIQIASANVIVLMFSVMMVNYHKTSMTWRKLFSDCPCGKNCSNGCEGCNSSFCQCENKASFCSNGEIITLFATETRLSTKILIGMNA